MNCAACCYEVGGIGVPEQDHEAEAQCDRQRLPRVGGAGAPFNETKEIDDGNS